MNTPELDKRHKAMESGDPQTIGEFLDWAGELGYALWHPEKGYLGVQRALNQYFEIDPDKIDQEQRALLVELTAANEKHHATYVVHHAPVEEDRS